MPGITNSTNATQGATTAAVVGNASQTTESTLIGKMRRGHSMTGQAPINQDTKPLAHSKQSEFADVKTDKPDTWGEVTESAGMSEKTSNVHGEPEAAAHGSEVHAKPEAAAPAEAAIPKKKGLVKRIFSRIFRRNKGVDGETNAVDAQKGSKRNLLRRLDPRNLKKRIANKTAKGADGQTNAVDAQKGSKSNLLQRLDPRNLKKRAANKTAQGRVKLETFRQGLGDLVGLNEEAKKGFERLVDTRLNDKATAGDASVSTMLDWLQKENRDGNSLSRNGTELTRLFENEAFQTVIDDFEGLKKQETEIKGTEERLNQTPLQDRDRTHDTKMRELRNKKNEFYKARKAFEDKIGALNKSHGLNIAKRAKVESKTVKDLEKEIKKERNDAKKDIKTIKKDLHKFLKNEKVVRNAELKTRKAELEQKGFSKLEMDQYEKLVTYTIDDEKRLSKSDRSSLKSLLDDVVSKSTNDSTFKTALMNPKLTTILQAMERKTNLGKSEPKEEAAPNEGDRD